jgi:hypothetical protein
MPLLSFYRKELPMSRSGNYGSGPFGFKMMYYALCIFLLAFIANTIAPQLVRWGKIDLMTAGQIREISGWVSIGTFVLYVIGQLIALRLASITAGGLYFFSLFLWLGVVVVTGLRLFGVVNFPDWVGFAEYGAIVLSAFLMSFYLQFLAPAISSSDLKGSAKVSIIFCIVMTVLWGVYIYLSSNYILPLAKLEPWVLFGMIIGTLVAIAMYAKAILCAANEMLSARTSSSVSIRE